MADISKIKLPDNSEYNLKDTTSGYIKSPSVPYLTCSTAAATAAKTTTLVTGSFTSADLVTGAQVIVKFTNANGVASPTLSVNGTTAKSIKRYGTTAPSTSAASSWNAGSCVLFIYDGTYWQQTDFLNSTYSEISEANITNGSGSTTGLITGRRAKKAVEAFAPVTSVNGSTGAVTVQETLVSGTNIKTINNTSLLGSGNISVGGGVSVSAVGVRNYAQGTDDFRTQYWEYNYDVSASGGVITYPARSSLAWRAAIHAGTIPYADFMGHTWTLSFDYRSDDFSDMGGEHYIYINMITTETLDSRSRKKYTKISTDAFGGVYVPTSTWQRGSITFTATDDSFWISGSGTSNYVGFQIYDYTLNHLQIRRVKLEKENIPSDWSRSEDDVVDFVVKQGHSGTWRYRKWKSGTVEAWGNATWDSVSVSRQNSLLYKAEETVTIPTGIFSNTPNYITTALSPSSSTTNITATATISSTTGIIVTLWRNGSGSVSADQSFYVVYNPN